MSDFYNALGGYKIARSLDHLKSSPWLLKPTIKFILSFQHKNQCKRIRILFYYLCSFGKFCPYFSLFFHSLIFRKYKPDSFIRPNWTRSDEADVNHLKIQTCLHIQKEMSSTKTTPFESLLRQREFQLHRQLIYIMRKHLSAKKAEQLGSVISNIVEKQKFIIFFGEPEMSERQIKTYLLAPHIYKATNNWRDIQYNGKPLFESKFEEIFEKDSTTWLMNH